MASANAEPHADQYVAYTLYRLEPAWRRLPVEERAAAKDAFAEVVEAWAERMDVRTYSLVGVRPEADFMFWKLTSASRTFASSPPTSTGPPSPAGSRRRTATSPRRARRSTSSATLAARRAA